MAAMILLFADDICKKNQKKNHSVVFSGYTCTEYVSYFDSNFTELCSKWCSWQKAPSAIGSGDGLAPIRNHAITGANVDSRTTVPYGDIRPPDDLSVS